MYDTLIIGSGLSSIFFLEGYKNKNKNKNEKMAVISYEASSEQNQEKTDVSLKNKIKDNLPPRFKADNIGSISDFFIKNKTTPSDNLSIFGLLQDGGVSNYWGMSCDFPKINKLDFLNKKNRDALINSFNYIYNKFNFEGVVSNENVTANNEKKIENYFSKVLECKNDNINFYKNCSAIDGVKYLIPSTINTDYSNIDKLNYFVNTIVKEGNIYRIHCTNSLNEKRSFVTKKLILACGTIGTTRLLLGMLNYEKPVKVFHNPMLFACILSNQKVQKDFKHWMSQIASDSFDSKTNSYAACNFRSTNEYIKRKIFKDYWFMKNFFSKYVYNFLAERMVFVNLYIEAKYSNLIIQKEDDNYKIFSSNENMKLTKKILHNHLTKNTETLLKNNLITQFMYSTIPKSGHDNHYTGTIKINKDDTPLSVDEMCELKNFDNLYIVDGSVIPGDISFFPTGIIIANAYRVGSTI